ncbi:uncharacterized protein BYT42DRAFT_566490 [Radiomyces spectabilis]|uniref:uncharacterized protein n=1 Tax=Radiomyces spectabilis TaxID=64574 RepID=UPI00221FED4A|nr:uncharacterized protein BYT42DRAFT_566490 [Radiomyces spectabilis]KAI8381425.1 hypothetical protein BYT42DRAFT_566490 [Radiomyces spectabilis]
MDSLSYYTFFLPCHFLLAMVPFHGIDVPLFFLHSTFVMAQHGCLATLLFITFIFV